MEIIQTYDPEVIKAIDQKKRKHKLYKSMPEPNTKPTTDSGVFDRDDASFKKKDYQKMSILGNLPKLKVTDPNRPARRVDPSKIVGRGYRAPKGTHRSQIVGRGRSQLDRAKKSLIGLLSASYSMLDRPKNLKEQTTFAQMQQRIRDAKEKRREQQKKSEKLYIDTKKKGVKFYDKKGSGRLKDGKKIYD